jgi:hypothetical protein
MYELPASLLVANPLNRYLINSPMLPGLRRDADGGLTLYLQHESPGPNRESNWLPAPAGPFLTVLRLYWPKPEAIEGRWKQPPLQREAGGTPMSAQSQPTAKCITVTADNFERAETDRYFGVIARQGGFGKFHHYRELMSIDKQDVVRANRDTLYSAALFDLQAGPVTITLPDAGKRFMSLMVLDEDQYSHGVLYGAGKYTFTREQIGTRYVMMAVRTLVDPANQKDVQEAHALQDAVKTDQQGSGRFEIPNWDQASQKKVRDALAALGSTLPDSKKMFGSKDQVDPVRHLIGTAMAWGGNPEKEATYLNVTPNRNDGNTIYRLTVTDVPVDGFWSISVYNAQGYFEPNKYNAYTLNNVTAKKGTDGSVAIQFGGCDQKAENCLPITPGWNYMVRLYRPRAEILTGKWRFPEAQPE